MKLLSENSGKVITSSQFETAKYGIKVCGKTFRILINGLYADKIKSIVRELSTNAYEAHQMLNKEKTPFKVTLPTWQNANFTIRDYGPGLSHEYMMNEYVSVGESSKENDDNMGGAFGLGSKSPFAYVTEYAITSYHNGEARIYIAKIDEDGEPSISLITTTPTTESGLEIQLAVQSGDITRFGAAANDIYKFFLTQPIGNYNATNRGAIKASGKGWAIRSNYDSAIAVMGNIAYPLTFYNGKHADLISHRGLELYFDIGEVEPLPSREALSYNKNTLRRIEERLEDLTIEFSKQAQTNIDKATCLYDAIVTRNAEQSKSSIPLNVNWKGNPIPSAIQLPVGMEYYSTNWRGKYSQMKLTHIHNIHPAAGSIFFIVDKCSYAQQRVKQAGWNNALGVEDDPAKIKAFCDTLHIPQSRLVKVSSLPKPTVAAKGTGGHKSKVHSFTYSGYSNFSAWDDVEIDVTSDSGQYVEIFNNKIVIDAQTKIDTSDFRDVVRFVYNKDVPFYGIKKDLIAKVGSNLTSLVDAIKNDTAKAIKSFNDASDNYETMSYILRQPNCRDFIATITNISSDLALLSLIKDSTLAKFIGDISSIYKDYTDYQQKSYKISNLKHVLNIPAYTGKRSSSTITDVNAMLVKYPLLGFEAFYGDVLKEIIVYLNAK